MSLTVNELESTYAAQDRWDAYRTAKLRPEVKEKWLAALRSGEYIQGRNSLLKVHESAYCCLGVLCEIAVSEGASEKLIKTYADDPTGTFSQAQFDGDGSLPGQKVFEWATGRKVAEMDEGQFSWNPEVVLPGHKVSKSTLSNANDYLGLNFNEIADLVEANL